MNSHSIIPTVLEETPGEIDAKIKIYKEFTDTIHIDFIDGIFTPNKTVLDPGIFSQYSKELFLEAHLMVSDPIKYLKPLFNSGFKRFLGHVEKMPDQAEFVAEGQLLGEVGLAVDGPTSLSDIEVPYEDLDLILVMTIKAGSSGNPFMSQTLQKIEEISSNTFIPIEVDGGIDERSILEAKKAGAERFCANSFLFKGNPKNQFDLLEKLVA